MTVRVSWLPLCAFTLFARDGAAIYQKRCSACHDAAGGRVPPLAALRAMDPSLVERALTSGSMKTHAEGLRSRERYALETFLAMPIHKSAPPPAAAFCGAGARRFSNLPKSPGWAGWSVDGANTRFQDAQAAGLTASDVPRRKLKWSFGLGDGIVARAQPSIASGRVFVGSQAGTVYALDARTGCIYWAFDAEGAVTPPSPSDPPSPTSATSAPTPTPWTLPRESCSGKSRWTTTFRPA